MATILHFPGCATYWFAECDCMPPLGPSPLHPDSPVHSPTSPSFAGPALEAARTTDPLSSRGVSVASVSGFPPPDAADLECIAHHAMVACLMAQESY